MKKTKLMSVLVGGMFVAGMLAGHVAYAGETSNDWDQFMKQIDPSSATAVSEQPLGERTSGPSRLTTDWETFLLAIDPSQAANKDLVLVCKDTDARDVATAATDWDRFMRLIDPSYASNARI